MVKKKPFLPTSNTGTNKITISTQNLSGNQPNLSSAVNISPSGLMTVQKGNTPLTGDVVIEATAKVNSHTVTSQKIVTVHQERELTDIDIEALDMKDPQNPKPLDLNKQGHSSQAVT